MRYDDPCDRPYGPGNPDYAHDARVQDALDERQPSFRDIVRHDRTALTVLRHHLWRARAKELFPDNELLQARWVEAKWRLRCSGIRRPHVLIGAAAKLGRVTLPRTLREAGIQGELA